MKPQISVIVPVYNTESYLDRCVQSILNQTYKNLEILLIDDGSTDRSAQMCDAYTRADDRVRVVHQKNHGQSHARNVGLDLCTGDYVGFVDSDDWISPTMYESLLSACKSPASVAIIGADEVTEDGKIISKKCLPDFVVSGKTLLRCILLHKGGSSVCLKLFPRAVIGDVRFHEDRLNEDVLFTVDLIPQIDEVTCVPEKGYYYFRRSGSTSRHFGKAIHDMVGNAVEIRRTAEAAFPDLVREAERFEIFQYVNFLLCCPSDYDRKADPMCGAVLSYVRKHLMQGLSNPHLTRKEKMKLLGAALAPRMMARMIERKAKPIQTQ